MNMLTTFRPIAPAFLLRSSTASLRLYSSRSTSKRSNSDLPAELQERPEAKYTSAYHQPGFGRIYDRKPTKFTLQKGKEYYWCTCGWSHNQPFCDGKHANPHYKITLKPMRIVPEETREFWLCNCKQSKRRPFCDGTHKTPEVMEAPRVYKNNF